jgi:RNA polymerase sigma-70 factor, ECF subfamily
MTTRPTPFADILFSRWPQGPRSAAYLGPSRELSERVDDALSAMVRKGEASWPGLSLPPASFVEYLTDRLAPDRTILEDLEALRAPDLYLACACARGDEHAISAFEREYLSAMDDVLERIRISGAAIDEAKQIVRHRLFIAEAGKLPHIVEYAGRGDLKRWVRVAAVREAFRVTRQTRVALGSGDAMLEAIAAPGHDLELGFMKRTYGQAFEIALRQAVDSLPARDRNLLRYYFAKGLSIDKLGVLYRIHRATAARQVQKVSAELVTRTRDQLVANLGIAGADVSSVLRLVQSDIGQTLIGILAEPA